VSASAFSSRSRKVGSASDASTSSRKGRRRCHSASRHRRTFLHSTRTTGVFWPKASQQVPTSYNGPTLASSRVSKSAIIIGLCDPMTRRNRMADCEQVSADSRALFGSPLRAYEFKGGYRQFRMASSRLLPSLLLLGSSRLPSAPRIRCTRGVLMDLIIADSVINYGAIALTGQASWW
jgi:hypothetical protein